MGRMSKLSKLTYGSNVKIELLKGFKFNNLVLRHVI